MDRTITIGMHCGKENDQVFMEKRHKGRNTQSLNQWKRSTVRREPVQKLVDGEWHRSKIHICGTPSRKQTNKGVQLNSCEWNQQAAREGQRQLGRGAPRSPVVIQDNTPHKHEGNSIQPGLRRGSNATKSIDGMTNTHNTFPGTRKWQGPMAKPRPPWRASRALKHAPSCIQDGCGRIFQPMSKR